VQPILLSPSDRQGEAIVDTPARELRILCEHDWLDATWTRHAAGERGAEPHVHFHHVDAFYVLSGEMTLRMGPDLDRVVATDDTLVLVPSGLVHGFDNDSSGEVRFLNFHAPGCGFVEYLRGRGEFDSQPPLADGGRPATDAIVTRPGGGKHFRRDDRTVTILGELPQVSVFRLEVEPEWPGIQEHFHDDQVDVFYVLEGEATLLRGEGVAQAPAGTFQAALPGVRHGVVHEGGRVVLLNVHGPDAGFAESIRRL
jgi:quercetin dioxygenase-like cupin family protein